ncbi:MAG TPA: ComF family protein, partial [Anaerolineales bacterium]|nr:ComF family protein [Anaerolineales bacterium]HNM36256.1 ComF family protein [Anaerolineales bacterium]
GTRWCDICQSSLKLLDGIVCDVCGLPQDKPGVCSTCLANRPRFHSLRAWTVFEKPIQPALHKLKYRRDFSMGDAIAAAMLPFVQSLNWNIDLVIPIPLGKQRMHERGYNQVAMIAKPLAMGLGLQYSPHALARRKETRSQVGLSREERQKNVHDAFQASGVQGKIALIMDDVSTTGSTLSSGAEALYAAGAKEVYALTVARALSHHDLRHV